MPVRRYLRVRSIARPKSGGAAPSDQPMAVEITSRNRSLEAPAR